MNNEDIKILIVEDDALIANNLKETLEVLGYTVFEPCTTAEEAYKLLNIEKFDIALLDINLNGKDDGLEIGKQISTTYKLPFIYLTAFSDKHTITTAAATQPSAYLVKPTNAATLFATIQVAINNFQKQTNAVNKTNEEVELSFFTKSNSRLTKVFWKDVASITAGKNYINIQAYKNGLNNYAIRSTLQQAMLHFIPANYKSKFVQVSRTQCVNILFIKEIKDNFIITDFNQIEIGDSYKNLLLNKLNITA